MAATNFPLSKLERMIEKIVADSLEKFMRFDKGKEKVIEDDEEAKDESEKKEHVDDTWQDDEFFETMLFSSKILPKDPKTSFL
ncbi:hypothetical protein JCGZ_05132 [Jatropha curcas]|uniref:Uncharacterized protein n=1 Tax=Jatropha curcas TaxID=180498 RepID=A0A067KRH1_JATCU|nr:hypothetical protein JCGZ_05132 [Jatropha curcas]